MASICKENTDENQQLLIRNAVSIQGKPVPSSSTRKSKSKSGKKKPTSQETPKKDFTFPVPRTPKKGPSSRGSTGCPKKTMPLLIGIYFYITTSTGMHLTYTIRKINILQGLAIETTPTPTLLPWLPWKQICQVHM